MQLGKTILFTDTADWSDEEIVLAYRSQHHIEEPFKQMKNPHFLRFTPHSRRANPLGTYTPVAGTPIVYLLSLRFSCKLPLAV